jgi:sporulation protein YlmC with PRC-barrel domain
MRKHLFITAFCAGFLALGAQAQLHSGTTTDTGASQDSSSKPSTWDRIKDLAATGRTSQHEVRASQLTSADVKSSSGESVGTISDVIINPSSGKVDFAVISLGGSTGETSSSTPTSGRTGTSSPTSGTANSSTSTSAGGNKQVAVPWTLLRPANTGSSTTASSMGQQTYTYSGDISKLQSAPAFDSTTDLTKPGWLQSIFSYFGMNSGSATGGATSPGSSSSGSSSRSYPNGNPSNNP